MFAGRRQWQRRGAVLAVAFAVAGGPAAAAEATISVGVLKFGTVNWELDVIKHHRLDAHEGVRLEVTPLASKLATAVALQGGAVDVIVTDWIWVSRQRAEGHDYTFVPHSRAAGGIIVRPDAGITVFADLAGKRLGVAGGPVDKSWLIFRAYARKTLGRDLMGMVEPVFAAPPLLNRIVLKGDLPAALNFWHYGARLKAKGMTELVAVADALKALGVKRRPPILGWVFGERWAEANRAAVTGFLRASLAAKRILARDDGEWRRLQPLTGARDAATLAALRDGYRAGMATSAAAEDVAAARAVFAILAELGGARLVGPSRALAPGTFWNGFAF